MMFRGPRAVQGLPRPRSDLKRSAHLETNAWVSFDLHFVFLALEAFGQNNPQQPAPAQVTTERTSFLKKLKKTVGLLTVKYDKEGRSWKDEGTCFFIYYPDERIGKDQGFGYLVTNRHVAVPGTCPPKFSPAKS